MTQKLITIPYHGIIRAKRNIMGPILTPHVEDIKVIGAMVSGGVTVMEVLKNGEHFALTLSNYAKDNNPVEEAAEEEEVKVPVEPKVDAPPVVTPPQGTNNKPQGGQQNPQKGNQQQNQGGNKPQQQPNPQKSEVITDDTTEK